jgi:hypothetical protein
MSNMPSEVQAIFFRRRHQPIWPAPNLPLVDAQFWRRRSVSIAARLLEGSTVRAAWA